MKKIKLMLVAFMAMVGVNAFAQAAGPYSNSTFKYDYDGTGCVITGLQEDIKSTITEVAIPETVPVSGTQKPVTGIGWEAFKGLTQITSVSIAKNVTHIDGGAFSGCTHLATVDLSAATGLTTLGNEVFAGTPSLTSLSFANCAKLVAFRIDFDATSAAAYNATLYGAVITGATYDGTTEPTDAEIDAALGVATYTGTNTPIKAVDAAAYNATLGGAVAAGDTWNYTPFVAFGGKNNYLTSVTLNENTTEIGVAFANIPNLATLNISGTKLAALRANALDYNTKITSLELPNTCQTIESSALANTAVATLTINSVAAKPQDIKTTVYGTTDVLTTIEFKGVFKGDIASGAFGKTKLTSVKFAEANAKSTTGIAAGAFVLAPEAASTVEIAKISATNVFAAGAFTGPTDATKKVALTISDVSAQPAKLVSVNVGTATVGSVNADFSVDALGDAQTIVFTTAFAEGKTLVAATNAVAATKVVFGTETAGIALAAGSIVADAFKDAATCSFYWFPETATAAFAADFAANAASGLAYTEANMSNKLFTTTAVAEKYQTPFLNDTELLNKVFIKASATAAETQEIEVNKKDGNWSYGKFIAIGGNYSIDADDAVVYSAYVDGVNIYMDPLRIVDGKYVVEVGEAVVIKNSTGDPVTATATADDNTMRYSWDGAVATLINDIEYEVDGLGAPTAVVGYEIIDNLAAGKAAYAMAKPETYNLTWKKFKATTNLPAGTIYVVTDVAESGRLNIIWLDSEEATAIKTVKSAKAENGAIFNLAGQKVNAAYKGVVIKDGKKFIQK